MKDIFSRLFIDESPKNRSSCTMPKGLVLLQVVGGLGQGVSCGLWHLGLVDES